MTLEVTCACQHCDGQIAFSQEMSGQRVDCPHCGLDTVLLVPPPTKEAAGILSAVLQDEPEKAPPATHSFCAPLPSLPPPNSNEPIKWWRKGAGMGDAHSMANLGSAYLLGHGVSQDFTEAVRWLRLAAERGDAMAQDHLGFCYMAGHGVSQNYVEAEKWIRMAAEQGEASARFNLGCLYQLGGHGVPADPLQAFTWWLKAAEQGDARAQNNVGCIYSQGEIVGQDCVEAYKWKRLAADQGFEDTDQDCKDLAAKMTVEQRDESQRRIEEFRRTAKNPPDVNTSTIIERLAEKGDPEARTLLENIRDNELVAKYRKELLSGALAKDGPLLKPAIASCTPVALPPFKGATALAPQSSALDMAKVDAITQETKEAAGILSAVLQDEPKNTPPATQSFCVPLPSLPPASSNESNRSMSSAHFVVVALQQGTDAWREWRHRGIGASEASTVMGENPFRTAADLFRAKCGPVCEFEQDTAMALGLELEPEARRLYIAKTGKQVYPACLQSTRYDWLRASLDGLAVDYDGAVEIKCGKSAYRTTMQTGAVPSYNYGQTQHILAVTGFNSLDFWCYWPDSNPLLITVPRNESYIERLLVMELEFWNQVEQWKARLIQQQKSEWEAQLEPRNRAQPATDEQKVRLKWFGCTWDDGITKGQASDAIEECIRLFPEKNQQYYDRPATEDQVKIMHERLHGCGYGAIGSIETEDGKPLTYGLAEKALRNLEIDAPMGDACLQVELASSKEDEWIVFNWHWGDLYREVTRDEFANAWALAFSRRKDKSEGPTEAEVFAALRELVIEFRRG